MRIQLIAIGSMGDVQPMIALGRTLMRRGYAVSLTAFDAFQAHAEAAGFFFSPLPGDASRFIGKLIPPGASPVTFLSRFRQAMEGLVEPFFDAIYAACQGADAVVCTLIGSTIYAIAEKLDIPVFTVYYCPMDMSGDYCLPILPQIRLGSEYNRMTYRFANAMISNLERQYARPWCLANGISPRQSRLKPDYQVSGAPVHVLHAYSPLIVPRPREWAENLHLTGFWQEPDPPFDPPEDLLHFLASGPPPVYIGFGSMTSGNMEAAKATTLCALKETGLRAILAFGWGNMTGNELPTTVYAMQGFAPHRWLFDRMQAIVHHGGAGTTAMGLRAGKPTLIVPFGSDQLFWAARVYALGCGPEPIPRARLTGSALVAALSALVKVPGYARQAKLVQEGLLKEQGVETAADIIQDTLGR